MSFLRKLFKFSKKDKYVERCCQTNVMRQDEETQIGNSLSTNEQMSQTDDVFIRSELKIFEDRETQTKNQSMFAYENFIRRRNHSPIDKESQTEYSDEWKEYALHLQNYYDQYYRNAYFDCKIYQDNYHVSV